MPLQPDDRDAPVTAAGAAERLDDAHAAWIPKLAAVEHPHQLESPDPTALSASLEWLGVSPDDAAEVLRTMPSPGGQPETWWLLERASWALTLGIRDGSAESLPSLPASLRLLPVHLILVTLDAIRGYHREFGIPDEVSHETLSFLGATMSAYRQSHGEAGIEISRWDWLRFSGRLYQVGRLQVTPYRIRAQPQAGPLFWLDDETIERLGPGFRRGDPTLGIHIPETGPLTPEECDQSFRRMPAAFSGMYPGEPLRVATCTSWLMDDRLAEYLQATSNILEFQRRFHLVPGTLDDDKSMLRCIFGKDHPTELDALPQRTTLQRAIVHHLRIGRHWRLRTGWLDLGGSD